MVCNKFAVKIPRISCLCGHRYSSKVPRISCRFSLEIRVQSTQKMLYECLYGLINLQSNSSISVPKSSLNFIKFLDFNVVVSPRFTFHNYSRKSCYSLHLYNLGICASSQLLGMHAAGGLSLSKTYPLLLNEVDSPNLMDE